MRKLILLFHPIEKVVNRINRRLQGVIVISRKKIKFSRRMVENKSFSRGVGGRRKGREFWKKIRAIRVIDGRRRLSLRFDVAASTASFSVRSPMQR